MASPLSQEEENYVRMSLLLTGISPRAARALFNHEFASSCLESSLKKEYNKLKDLQKKRVINQSQWNLLFPRFPNVPDSKSFDVTLIITLLRNLTCLTPPHGGYDRLPSVYETTPTSDLARIKYYRNFLAHLDEGKVDNAKFTTAWDNVVDIRWTRNNKECDKLKVKILDQTNQEIILNIKRSNNEIMELKDSVESLKKANDDMTVEMNKLKLSYEDTVPWNIRAQISEILVEWKDNDKMFIKVRGTKRVLKCLKENSCVTITASSGVGKTATLRHVALQMAKEGYDLPLVTDPSDIVKFYNPNQKTLFVIDDLFGNYSLNRTNIDVWEPNPFTVYEAEIDKLQKKGFSSKYCALALCVMFNNNVKEDILTEEVNEEIRTIIENTCEACKKTFLCSLNELDVSYQRHLALTCDVRSNDTALLQLCFKGDIPMIHWCINHNGDVNQCRVDGTSPLKVAALKGWKEIVRMLLEKGADCNKCTTDGVSTVMSACGYGHTEIVRMLLDIGADYNKCDNNGWSTVISACSVGHTEIVRMLLNIGADYNKCNNTCWTPVMFACRNGYTEIVKMLLYKGALYNQCDHDGWSPIVLACIEGHTDIVRILLDIGAEYNKCENDGWSLVMLACIDGHTEIVRMLLDIGADYNISNNDGWTPVMSACRNGHKKIVKMLLDKGADYKTCYSDCVSLVMLACTDGHTEIVRMLLDTGADYNTCDDDSLSPVMLACIEGHIEIVRMLLDKGADYNTCDSDCWSVVMLACRDKHTEVVRVLLDIGADYNACANDGWSPLMIACIEGHIEIVRMLLDIGADYDKCDNDG
ncbi:unnamed protein product [Mytilus coruscus]|uniref:Uncharacterized protein n=1 Tax=Mytilus coruscus TaxID=42192 RepID=A0A6J8C1J9_MYTCO|nr:unnamed protein product [Mytilus coruscus]